MNTAAPAWHRGLGAKFDTIHRQRMYAKALGPKGLFTTTPTLTTGMASIAAYEALGTDQGPSGSCEGHSGAMGAWMALAASGSPLPWFPSPDGIYRDARCQERSPAADGSLPPLTDSGCMTSDVVTIFQTCGLRKMNAPTSDGRNSDVDPATVNNEPRLDQLDTEAETPILIDPNAYLVDLTDLQEAFAVIQAALKAKLPVRIDIICDSIFQAWFQNYTNGAAPISSCNPNDPNAGGHALLLEEALVTSANSITFAGLNSWGAIGAPALAPTGCINSAGHWQGDANWFKSAVQMVTVWNCSRMAA